MLFNSIEFLLFFILFYIIYWLLRKNLLLQNSCIFIASYIFYGWWDWRFVFLLMLSTLIDYFSGLIMAKSSRPKFFLVLSVINNLALLCFFKYFNFFVSSFSHGLESLGLHSHPLVLNIILPVGISFYTFHGMSYVFDIYRKKIEPTKNFIEYSVFVSFFPLLVAGPIERADHLLPQVKKERVFNYQQSVEGLRLILWGLFKKVVIADTLATYVDRVFGNFGDYRGSALVLAVIYFSFEIYCDFSGYTDIALGLAKLLGIELLTNFKFPYFSRDIAEFWRRWHVSLSSWFKDYLYIPLGGSRVSVTKAIRNTYIIFLLSGFWHGARWTFVIWGFIHATFFIPLMLVKKNRDHSGAVVANNTMLPTGKEFFQMLLTFTLVSFAWIFFRAPSLGFALSFIRHISSNLFLFPPGLNLLGYVMVVILIDWSQRRAERNVLSFGNKWLRYGLYLLMGMFILMHLPGDHKEFIYFKF
jgi:alginate O-acetyltransferase complex protein AlgI